MRSVFSISVKDYLIRTLHLSPVCAQFRLLLIERAVMPTRKHSIDFRAPTTQFPLKSAQLPEPSKVTTVTKSHMATSACTLPASPRLSLRSEQTSNAETCPSRRPSPPPAARECSTWIDERSPRRRLSVAFRCSLSLPPARARTSTSREV